MKRRVTTRLRELGFTRECLGGNIYGWICRDTVSSAEILITDGEGYANAPTRGDRDALLSFLPRAEECAETFQAATMRGRLDVIVALLERGRDRC